MELFKITEAIKTLTDNSFTIIGEDLDNIIWESDDKNKPTKTQILKQVEKLTQEEANQQAAKLAAKESAIAKLIDLGLTEEEAKAFLG